MIGIALNLARHGAPRERVLDMRRVFLEHRERLCVIMLVARKPKTTPEDSMTPTHVADLAAEVEIADDSTISKTLYEDDRLKVVLFGFAPGQELSEHTASVPAVMHFLEGKARVTLGEEVHEVAPHAWTHMPAHLPHSIVAHTRVKMLLLLLRDEAA